MKKLVFSGNDNQLDIIARQARTRVKKYGLSMQLVEVETESDVLTADECITLIKAAENVEDLKPYENDTRKTVAKAYNFRLKELGG